MSDFLIRAENVGKKFCRNLKKSLWYGVKDSVHDLLRQEPSKALRNGEFWANKDVTFEVKRGECFGLIGRNGAGKTTLLKMLNGLIKPDEGSITIKGNVGALIALGAGFNPILSGRENIFVNGSIIGMSKRQIIDKVDEIVEFAEIGDSIDAPVRTYSSGMNVRLGFGIAVTMIRPDVLLLDEVLAVGDAGFRHRCYSRMEDLMSTSAVILVSHSMEFISQCATKVGLMTRGEMVVYEAPASGVVAYNDQNRASDDSISTSELKISPPISQASVRLLTPNISYGERLEVHVEIECHEDVGHVEISLPVRNMFGKAVMCWNSRREQTKILLTSGKQIIRFGIDPILLHDGEYQCSFNLTKAVGIDHLVWHRDFAKLNVRSEYSPISDVPYLPRASYLRTDEANCAFGDVT